MSKFPSKDEILRLIAESRTPLTKREIVGAFDIRGDGRILLKEALRAMEAEGAIIKQPGQTYAVPSGLPAVTVVEVYEIDIDGDVFARPTDWKEEQGPAPRIELMPDKAGTPSLKEGDRVLAALRRFSDEVYEGKVLRRLDDPRGQVMGLVRQAKNGFIVSPTDKKARYDFDLPQKDLNGATPGDLVLCEIQPARSETRKKVRVVEVIGREDDPKAISLIAIHSSGLRSMFPPNVIAETEGMTVPTLKDREDLTKLPLVTIDGADARDFDDAVFAEKTDDGFHLLVAIADVAYYVRPGKPLDQEAYKRGNSTYFPDRVVPMLPEALSNDLCSLRPRENRACMAIHLWIDNQGNLQRHKVVRGIMNSIARLTYEQVQAAKDGVADDTTEPLMKDVITPLYEAYAVLNEARMKRGALELDLKERQILIDKNGKMTGVKNRERYDSHKLIEEFMILANVAAATALENKKAPCVYRVHDRPSEQKLDNAREFLETFGLSLPKGQVTQPHQINAILAKAAQLEYSHLISEVILRTQSQAIYSPENLGHFGLSLKRYAHFTSPIRRYADLLVHRSLIRAYGLGPGGLDDEEAVQLEEMSEHISQTERTSAEAERSAVDRFTAAWLSERIGAEFSGRINGVTRFGLFVTLDENGADGLVPMRSLPNDFYVHEEKQHALIGRKTGRVYRLGASVRVTITEADGLTGSSLFNIVGTDSADIPGVHFKASRMTQGGRYDRDRARDKKKKHRGGPPRKEGGGKPKRRK
jgi:ribonuclease R